MALSIKHPAADRLARERRRKRGAGLRDDLSAIAARCAGLPVVDGRSANEILGYDDHGLPR